MTRGLTRFLRYLHENDEQVRPYAGEVKLGPMVYKVAELSLEAFKTVGGGGERDVPFTLWEIRDLEPGRSVLRIRLRMSRASFEAQIGTSGVFYAYGEGILNREIEDVLRDVGAEGSPFKKVFCAFTQSRHLVPDVFEYVITSSDPRLTWKTTPISTNLSARYV